LKVAGSGQQMVEKSADKGWRNRVKAGQRQQ